MTWLLEAQCSHIKKIHKMTWQSPDNTFYQIENVLIDVRHCPNLLDVWTYRILIIDGWNHFNELLNTGHPIDPYEETVLSRPGATSPPPSLEEVELAIKKLKLNKSPGPNCIPAELFKKGGPEPNEATRNYFVNLERRGPTNRLDLWHIVSYT